MSPSTSRAGHSEAVAENPNPTSAEVHPNVLEWRRSILQITEVAPWDEPVDGAALLDDLRKTLTRHVVLPPHASEMLAMWVLHTYAFPLRNVTTYVGIVSPEKRCGKTTLLSLLGMLVNRPIVASNISPPALFRVIEEMGPTLVIDEADTFLQGNEEMRGILNSGYSRETAYVVRVAGSPEKLNNLHKLNEEEDGSAGTSRPTSRLARFSCWCPKVLAAIGQLPETLTDRCVVVTMQRKAMQEQCERLRNLDATELRRKCVRFVRDHAEAIRTGKPQVPSTLNDRAVDIWEPLLVLAELAEGEWPKLAREAAVKLSGYAEEGSPIAVLLFDIFLILMQLERERMFSRDVVRHLNEMQERPWEEMRKGKPLTELSLSALLRPYGIRPRTVWIGSESAKGYLLDEFTEVVGRYALPVAKQVIEEHRNSQTAKECGAEQKEATDHGTGKGAPA